MKYVTEPIAQSLKAARDGKGLSQRALSKLTGVPQSHISKIESGAVDLRLSSLIELARVLDLELTLVPRKSVSAVRTIVRNTQPEKSARAPSAVKELKRLQNSLSVALHDYPAIKELAQIQRQVRELQHFKLDLADLNPLREANDAIVQALKDPLGVQEALRSALSKIQATRNALVHQIDSADAFKQIRSAYSLETDRV